MIEFSEDYPLLDKEGRVDVTIEQGGNLYYQRIPTSAVTLTLHFYRKPVEMDAEADTPDGIPTHLQVLLLVSFACWKIFELIEDGIDEPTPNTDKYERKFLKALKTLELSIPFDARSLFLGD